MLIFFEYYTRCCSDENRKNKKRNRTYEKIQVKFEKQLTILELEGDLYLKNVWLSFTLFKQSSVAFADFFLIPLDKQ